MLARMVVLVLIACVFIPSHASAAPPLHEAAGSGRARLPPSPYASMPNSEIEVAQNRAKYCAGKEDGRDITRRWDGIYGRTTPKFNNCRECCEGSHEVAFVARCLTACWKTCSDCKEGSLIGLDLNADIAAHYEPSWQRGGNGTPDVRTDVNYKVAGGRPSFAFYSPNRKYSLSMQADGNLVVYAYARPIWSSATAGGAGRNLVMQDDCNLVVYDESGKPTWASNTSGAGKQCNGVMQDDGNFVIYGHDGRAVWSTLFGKAER